jgi:hypothetical protein
MGKRALKCGLPREVVSLFYKKLEATTGFEPVNRGFADPRLNHLATSP